MAERFFLEFPPITTDEWLDAMRKDMRGKDPGALNWTDENGLEMKPFYREEDVAGLPTGVEDAPRGWEIWVEVNNLVEARQAVAMGADGLIVPESPEIDWSEAAAWTTIHMPLRADSAAAHNAGATPMQELALVLFEASLNEATAAVGLAAGRAYFGEIAKFRAMRRLWDKLRPQVPLHIHARTARWDKTAIDPHGNILRSTTEAMAAIIGGCNSLVVGPFDEARGETSALSLRLAINTQLILREEARLGDVADPASGCWYIESLTARLTDAAWEQFEKLRAGEFVRLSNKRHTKFVGVNLYPDESERVDPSVLARYPFRGAAPFESKRATEASNGH